MAELFTLPKQVPIQSSGAPWAGAKAYFYRAGTTTDQSVYTDAACSVAHAQPVVADANGVFAPIYKNPAASYDYRLQLKQSDGTLIYDVDDVPRFALTQAQVGRLFYPRTAAEIAAGVTPTSYHYQPLNPLRYTSGNDISVGIQLALNVGFASGSIPVTVEVPVREGGYYWDWGQEVDISADSGVTLVGLGFVYAQATAAIRSFVVMGNTNKNNFSRVANFSFNAGNYNHDAAVFVGSSSRSVVEDIELKATGSGKFTDGVILDESINTSGEQGSGFEGNVIQRIYDSGDSAVTRDMVHVIQNAHNVKISRIRATGDSFDHIVANTGNTMGGCVIEEVTAVHVAARGSPGDALVSLSGNIYNTEIRGIHTVDGTGTGSFNYGLSMSSPGGSAFGNSIARISALYVIKPANITGTWSTQNLNGRMLSPGNFNEVGFIFSNPTFAPPGAVIYDSTNDCIWTEISGSYVSPNQKQISTSVADDGVLTITIGTTAVRAYGCLVAVSVEGGGGAYNGVVTCRTNTAATCSALSVGGSLNTTTGTLSGTTGTDAKCTVSAHTDGKIYLENRSGAARRVTLAILT